MADQKLSVLSRKETPTRLARCHHMTSLVPNSGRDWTEDERSEINRLQRACELTGSWHLECDHSESGDPWCIIYDRELQVIVHIARIDRRYIVVFPPEPPLRSAIMKNAVDLVLDRVTTIHRQRVP